MAEDQLGLPPLAGGPGKWVATVDALVLLVADARRLAPSVVPYQLGLPRKITV